MLRINGNVMIKMNQLSVKAFNLRMIGTNEKYLTQSIEEAIQDDDTKTNKQITRTGSIGIYGESPVSTPRQRANDDDTKNNNRGKVSTDNNEKDFNLDDLVQMIDLSEYK